MDHIHCTCCSLRVCSKAPDSSMALWWSCTCFQNVSMPSCSTADMVIVGGCHEAFSGRTMRMAADSSRAARFAFFRFGPSALLIATRSAISRMPFLMPCSWSPAPANARNVKQSTICETATSDWPTPTVSTRITSNPAASNTTMDSRVALATPPRVPADGDGRINALSSRASLAMRVLSPRIEPRVFVDDGSMASTASLWPSPMSVMPRASMNVDLPTPGTPVMPTRNALPVKGKSLTRSSCASTRWAGAVDSSRVMAREMWVRSPARTPVNSSSTSMRRRARVTISGATAVCSPRSVPAVVMREPRWCSRYSSSMVMVVGAFL